jgi:pimeloyl-ACP methyl ester carboxylesterase
VPIRTAHTTFLETDMSDMTDGEPAPRLRRRGPIAVLALAFTLLLSLALPGASSATGAAATHLSAAAVTGAGHGSGAKPTIVFVHGAFADASGFAGSIGDLQRAGYPVLAPPNPLRGLTTDSDSLRTFLSTVAGPIVLVGHSYGGAVITNAATGNPNVKALVYVAAYALAEGETVEEANGLGGGSSNLLANIQFRPIPGVPAEPPPAGDLDAYIKLESFRAIFAADVPAATAAVMAATQRPATVSSLVTPSGPPAWKTIPSWYLVAGKDKAIPPEAERAMARRAHATTVEIRSSHAVMVSHPKAVTALVLAAVRGTR